MTLLDEIKSLAAEMDLMVARVEAAKGAQPKLRHHLHGAQGEIEALYGMAAGSLVPDGGIPKPSSGTSSVPAS